VLQDAVQVAGIVARPIVAIEFVLGEEMRMLAILFRFVVLLAIFDEAPTAFIG
jgi:hypothetical protein